jgi:hypothetical protein
MFDEKSRIRRILYSFNIRKIYTYIRRFAKPKEDPFAALTSVFVGPSKPQKEVKEEMKFKGTAAKARTPIFKTILLLAIIIAIIGAAFIIISSIKFEPPQPPEQPELPPLPIININVTESGYLDSFDGKRWYATVAVDGSNLDYANLTLSVFKDFAPQDVFILRSVRKDAINYREFKSILQSRLESYGISVTEITADDVLRMPKESKIVLIVPSGYMPTFFLGMEDPDFDMMKFTQRGNVVIYVGRSLTEYVISRSGDLTPAPPEKTEKLGISFQAENRAYDKFKPLYRVQQLGARVEGLDLRSQTGSASVTWGGGGYVYLLPTTIDGWWSYSKENSAGDLSDIIANAYWGYYYVSGADRIDAKDGILNTTNKIIFTDKLQYKVGVEEVTQAYGRLFVKTEKVNDSVKAGKIIQLKFQSPPNGRIENAESVISTSISGNDLDLSYSLNELMLREDNIFIQIVNSSGSTVKIVPLGMKSLKVKDVYRLPMNVPSGNYMLKIMDSAGSLLAQSFLHLSSFTIEPQSMGWDLKLFIFSVYAEGDTKNPYTKDIKSVKVSLDGKEEKEVKLIGGRLTYETSYFPSVGNHTFKFIIGDDTIIKEIPFMREPSFIEKYWYMIIITVMVFGVGFLIRRPEKMEYNIDVPDFPPLHSIAIPIKRETILDMFPAVNKELKWEHTPLAIQDLKSAFRKISVQGRPVIIGEYNLEHILDKLVEEGQLKKALGYYGLVSWEKEARKSIYTLSMQRALRDLFVVEGVPFIPFGQRTDCDTIVSVGGEKISIHIYEDDSVIYGAVQTAPQGRTVIVFEDEQSMRDFTSRIHSSSETNVIFKMLLDDPNGNVILTPIDKLIDILNKKYSFFYY